VQLEMFAIAGRRWLQQGVANVLLYGVKISSLSQVLTEIVRSFYNSQTERQHLKLGCTYILQIQAPHQCPRCQKCDMMHVPYWRLTLIKHHHKKFSYLNDLLTGIFLPLPKVHSGTLLALDWYLEGKCAQNGSMWFSIDGWVLTEHSAWSRDRFEKLIAP
jgi:hypothetical protein